MKINQSLLKILNLKFDIEHSLFQKTRFKKKEVEENFQAHMASTFMRSEKLSNLLTILGYIACLAYILFAFFRIIPILICLGFFTCSIILTVILHFSKKKSSRFVLHHLQILFSSLNFLTKSFFVCYYYRIPGEDHFDELVRIIIYDFISVNIFIITKLEGDIKTSLFYFIVNSIIIAISHKHSLKNRFYFLEAFTSFFVFAIFYIMRKEYDLKLRLIFQKQHKFERLYDYISDYIHGLNGYVLNIHNNDKMLYNCKINDLAKNIFYESNHKKSKEYEKENLSKSKDAAITNISSNSASDSQEYEEANYKTSENAVVVLLKNLFFFENYESEFLVKLRDINSFKTLYNNPNNNYFNDSRRLQNDTNLAVYKSESLQIVESKNLIHYFFLSLFFIFLLTYNISQTFHNLKNLKNYNFLIYED